jgi:hypothetical protein
MPVNDQQVAALRTLLAREFDEHRRLYAALDRDGIRKGYAPLISAAFCIAVERRFSEDSSRADIIEFVADARSRAESAMTAIEPAAGERIIRAVYGDEDITDIHPNKRFEIQMALLAALAADENFDDSTLDEFLAAARKLADQMAG